MPPVEWSLVPAIQPQGQHLQLAVQLDATMIRAGRGIFGPALQLPFKCQEMADRKLEYTLLSLEGWIWWSTEDSNNKPGLRIPLQAFRPYMWWLTVPITDAQIEAIEEARRGEPVTLNVLLAGLASLPTAGVTEVRSGSNQGAPSLVTIGREQWLGLLKEMRAGKRRLVELPEVELPHGDTSWAEHLRHLNDATQHFRRGEYDHQFACCRKAIEGTAKTLARHWGITWNEHQREKPFGDKVKELQGRLKSAWPEDEEAAIMLGGLLSAAWTWTSPTLHAGSKIPLREEATFSLSLCTDVLMFAPQVMKAHPQLIPKPPATTAPQK